MKEYLKRSRNHLLCRFEYRRIQRRGEKNIRKEKSGSVVINISNPALFHRYLYTLLKFFSLEGYNIYFPLYDFTFYKKNLYKKNTEPWNYFNLIFSEGIAVLGRMPAETDYLELNDSNFSPDYYFLKPKLNSNWIQIPMTMHPLFYYEGYWKVSGEINKKRKSSVFVSGNLNPLPYQNFKTGIFQQENRAEICHYLRLKSFNQVIFEEKDLQDYIQGNEDFRVIMIDTHKLDIPMPKLRPVLSEFNFFSSLTGGTCTTLP